MPPGVKEATTSCKATLSRTAASAEGRPGVDLERDPPVPAGSRSGSRTGCSPATSAVRRPGQLSEKEVAEAVKSVIAELGATTLKDMGRTMAALKERYAGQMDFSKASGIVKQQLS